MDKKAILNHVSMFCLVLGSIVLIAGIIMMPAIGIVGGVLIVASGGYWLIGKLHTMYIAWQHRKLDVQERKQALRHADERHIEEIQGMRANRHVQLTRVWADPNGNRPIIIQPDMGLLPSEQDVLMFPAGQMKGTRIVPETPPALPAIAAPLTLPGPVSMIEVMKHWDLSPEHLFLAIGKGNRSLACSIDEFMHVAHDGPTGSGKTMQWKAEIVMLLCADVLTFLANPHFAPVTKKGEDWRPIAQALERQELPGQLPGLLYSFEHIRDFLRWLSQVEIDQRFEHQRAGRYDYAPLYGFIDEWAAQVSKYPECGEYMQDIIRRGRAVDVCVSTNSQGFLTADIGMSGASRENFQTAYHLGGSVASASALLDMRQQDVTKLLAAEQISLGKGIALLRNNAVSDPAQLVRLPLADNDYVYYMLGRADNWALPEYRKGSVVVEQDEMELLQPRGFSESFQSAPYTPYERGLRTDSGFQTGPLQRDFDENLRAGMADSDFSKNAGNRPVDGSDRKTDEGLKYRFTETEIVQFIAAYKVVGNIEKVLSSMRKGSGYKQHARELIQAHRLRENA